MRTKQSRIIASVAVMAILLLGSVALAKCPASNPDKTGCQKANNPDMVAKMKEKLGLTNEQAEQMKGLMSSKKEQMGPVYEVVKVKQKALDKAVEAGADEQAIRALAAELGKAIGDKAVLQASKMAAVKKVLTEEQFAKWKVYKSKFGAHYGKTQGQKGEYKATKESRSKNKVKAESCDEHKGHKEGAKDFGAYLKKKDSDGDGKLTVEEFTKYGYKTKDDFKKADTDGDGSVSIEELAAFKKQFKSQQSKEK